MNANNNKSLVNKCGGVVKTFHVDSQLLQMLCYFILLLLSFVLWFHCLSVTVCLVHIKFKLKSKTFQTIISHTKTPSIQLLNVYMYILLVLWGTAICCHFAIIYIVIAPF